MAESKWREGQRARYTGLMERRRGQEVEIVAVSGLIGARFPDGKVIGCAPHSLSAL